LNQRKKTQPSTTAASSEDKPMVNEERVMKKHNWKRNYKKDHHGWDPIHYQCSNCGKEFQSWNGVEPEEDYCDPEDGQIAQLQAKNEALEKRLAELQAEINKFLKDCLVNESIPESSDQWTACGFCGKAMEDIHEKDEHALWCPLRNFVHQPTGYVMVKRKDLEIITKPEPRMPRCDLDDYEKEYEQYLKNYNTYQEAKSNIKAILEEPKT
jgi:hypothetical protein